MLRMLPSLLAVLMGVAVLADDRSARQKVPQKSKVQPGRHAALILQLFDRDKDGSLSRQEAPPRLAENFKWADRDGDGQLDRHELTQLLQGPSKLAAIPEKAEPGRRAGHQLVVGDLLRRLDKNQDGKISKDEAQGPLAGGFRKLDSNQDGLLDRRELQALTGRRPAVAAGPAGAGELDVDFDALDKDADGRLTAKELRGTPLADRVAELDSDKDGKLSRKEFEARGKK